PTVCGCTLCASVLFSSFLPHRALPSFPTRRSSDLIWFLVEGDQVGVVHVGAEIEILAVPEQLRPGRRPRRPGLRAQPRQGKMVRSEEHTSELQSHLNLVCRLLLEKKKNIQQTQKKS